MEVSDEVKTKLKLWSERAGPRPSWYVWTGGWYEMDGDGKYYVNHPLTTESIVFDVGGYEGAWTSRIVQKYDCTVYLFEPAPRAFKLAQERLKVYSKVILSPFALGASDGTFSLGDSNRDGSSFHSTLSPVVQVIKADIVRIFKVFNISYVNLMSINIEGDEFELLPRIIESGLVTSIYRFMIQWHSVGLGDSYRQLCIQEQLSHTHTMEWNLGAWEVWNIKQESH